MSVLDESVLQLLPPSIVRPFRVVKNTNQVTTAHMALMQVFVKERPGPDDLKLARQYYQAAQAHIELLGTDLTALIDDPERASRVATGCKEGEKLYHRILEDFAEEIEKFNEKLCRRLRKRKTCCRRVRNRKRRRRMENLLVFFPVVDISL